MMLAELLEDYCLERGIDKSTAYQYRRSVEVFEEFLGQPAAVTDLELPAVNRWIAWLQKRYSPVTVKNRRVGILVLWNYAEEAGFSEGYKPKRIRKVKSPKQLPKPWSAEQARVLLSATKNIRGMLRAGVPAWRFMEAYVRVACDTGLRPDDILLLRTGQLEQGGTIELNLHKTGYYHVVRLSERTLAAVWATFPPERELVFPLTRGGLRRWELALFDAAGERLGRKRGEGIAMLRKYHATEIAREHGLEAAARSLGHVTGTTIVANHYVERKALYGNIPLPPTLDGG